MTLQSHEVGFHQPEKRVVPQNEFIDIVLDSCAILGVRRGTAIREWVELLDLVAHINSGHDVSATWKLGKVDRRMPDGADYAAHRGMYGITPEQFCMHHEPGTSCNIYDLVASTVVAMKIVIADYNAFLESPTTIRIAASLLNKVFSGRIPAPDHTQVSLING